MDNPSDPPLLTVLFLLWSLINTDAYPLPKRCGSENPIFYDSGESICCNGIIHPLTASNGTKYGCCTRMDSSGNETHVLYDIDLYLCCGAFLVDLYDGSSYKRECCQGDNKTLFPGQVLEEGYTCCNGKSYLLKAGEACCGAMTYDMGRYLCCEDFHETSLQPYDENFKSPACCYPGHETFDLETHWCDDGEIKSRSIDDCNGRDYDKRTDVCCQDGTLLKKPDPDYRYPVKYGCCNNRLINVEEEQCCYEDVYKNIVEHPIPHDRICCGNASVKKDLTEECCNGFPNKVDLNAREPLKCCGTSLMREQDCCHGEELHPEYKCCGQRVAYRKNSPLRCCNGEVYDSNHQLCCKKSSAKKYIIDKEKFDHTDCCSSTQTGYNAFTHNCTGNGIIARLETRNADILACPYCSSRKNPSLYCKAKSQVDLEVKAVILTDRGSLVTAVTDSGKRIRIRMPYRCHCIVKNGKYLLLTSRRLRKRRFRVKSKSMFFKKGDDTYEHFQEVCKVGKKIIRRIKSNA